MKEFIEKVKSRLVEMREFHNELSRSNELSGVSKCCQKINTGCFAKAIQIVDEVAEEYNNGWIPCSERLPECEDGWETGALLFQLKETNAIRYGYYGVCGIYRDKYFRPYTDHMDGFDAEDVIAWQPLPEPYQSKED